MDPDSKRLRIAVTDGSGRPAHVRGLTQWLARVAPARARGEVAIALVSDGHLRELNRQYRRKDSPTDVLSFPTRAKHPPSRSSRSRTSVRAAERTNQQRRTADHEPRITNYKPRTTNHEPRTTNHGSDHLGDIVIATGVARRQAKEAGHSYATELRVLALHGLLHLLGYDHDDDGDAGRMGRLEARLRRAGGLREGLIERGTPAARAR